MSAPLLAETPDPLCFVEFDEVEPHTNWRPSQAPRMVVGERDLLLIGADPQPDAIRSARARTLVGELLTQRRARRAPLRHGEDSHVSAAQIAVWLADGWPHVAQVGRNPVFAQPWGRPPASLADAKATPLG